MEKNDRITKAAEEELLKASSLLIAIKEIDGSPRIFAMEKVVNKGLGEILFITKTASFKVECLRECANASVAILFGENCISLKGKFTIITGEKEMYPLLPVLYIERLKKHEKDKYCILKFQTKTADLYISNERFMQEF